MDNLYRLLINKFITAGKDWGNRVYEIEPANINLLPVISIVIMPSREIVGDSKGVIPEFYNITINCFAKSNIAKYRSEIDEIMKSIKGVVICSLQNVIYNGDITQIINEYEVKGVNYGR